MLFRKKTAEESQTGRRRPGQYTDTERPSTPIFSYHSRRSQRETLVKRDTSALGAANVPDKRLRQSLMPRGRLLIIGVALLVIVAWQLLLIGSPAVSLQTSAAASGFPYDVSGYQQTADAAFNSSLLNHLKLTTNAAAIKAAIAKQYPELATVNVSVPLIGSRLDVSVDPGTPALRETTAQGQNVVLDSRGIVMNGSYSSSYAAHLPHITDQSGLPIQVGHVALPSTTVGFIRTVVAELTAEHASIASMTLPARSSELDVQLTGVSYLAKFNLQTDVRQQVGTLLATKLNLDNQHLTPAKYIDVRVPGRAYYL